MKLLQWKEFKDNLNNIYNIFGVKKFSFNNQIYKK